MKEALALAKKLIQDSKHLNGIKPPLKKAPIKAQKILKSIEEYRGRAMFYPKLMTGKGNGPYLEFADGSVKLDFITGIGVNFLGYSNPNVIKQQIKGISQANVYESHLICTDSLEKFLRRTVNLVNKDTNLRHCFPAMSGAMANENAMKVAFHNSIGRDQIVVFKDAFHGRTHLMAQMTDNASYRVGLPTPFTVHHIPFFNENKPKESLLAFKEIIKKNKNKIAVLGCELVQGEGGYISAPSEYFKELFSIAKKEGIKIWADEIQTGGRMVNTFRYRDLDLGSYIDILTLGKMTQVCSTLFTHELNPKPGLLNQTYAGSSAVLGAAEASLDLLNDNKFYGKNKTLDKTTTALFKELKKISIKYPDKISSIRNFGGMFAFQYKDGSKEETLKYLNNLLDNGLVAFFCGHGPFLVRFLPPIPVLKQKHINEAIQIIEKTL
jgi:4-aminobutyrate aminotransferase-like enzyme